MTPEHPFLIRRAVPADRPALGRLGGMLLRAHYDFDHDRFMAPGANPERGYASFLTSQLDEPDVCVFVAESRDGSAGTDPGTGSAKGAVIGYVYAGLEPRSWKELREAAGFIHDVAVTADARRQGAASALMDAAMQWLKEQGAPRVVLWSAAKNENAQRLFERLGFRRTMVEMTKEL